MQEKSNIFITNQIPTLTLKQGDGTRTGTGACQCDEGYNGTDCHVCADMHYEVERNEEQLTCSGKLVFISDFHQ